MAGFLVTNFWMALVLHLADTLMLGSLVAFFLGFWGSQSVVLIFLHL